METLKVNNKVIEYVIERKRIKNYYISIKNGIVTVKVPMRTSQENIEEVLLKRAEWILENVEQQKKKRKKPHEYLEGETFKVLAKDVILNISYQKTKKPKLKFSCKKFCVTLPEEYREDSKAKVQKLIDDFYTDFAEKEIGKAMQKMKTKVGIEPNQYKIKNLKSTWGNCSTAGNISINKNVVMYSKHAIEYVCLHELCHLQNMNHSVEFWNMVEAYMPDYKKAENELKG